MKRIFYFIFGLLIAGIVLLPTNGRTEDSQGADQNVSNQQVEKKEAHKKKAKKAHKKSASKQEEKETVKDQSDQKEKSDIKEKSNEAKEKSPQYTGHAMYVASKNSHKKFFHLATSSIAKRIKPENLVEFSSREEAEKAGYQPDKEITKQK